MIASRIREALGDRKPADLSRLSGVSETRIGRWLKAKESPSCENLVLISRALDVSVSWLLGETDFPLTVRVGDMLKDPETRRVMTIKPVTTRATEDEVIRPKGVRKPEN